MENDTLALELMHSLIWMCDTSSNSYKHRSEINDLTYVPDMGVNPQATFSIHSDDEDQYRLEALLRNVLMTPICTVAETDYEHRAKVQLHFSGPDLRSSLSQISVADVAPLSMLIETFLDEASRFDSMFFSSKDGQRALHALPISKDWCSIPRHFKAPVEALSTSGYCEIGDQLFRWSPSVEPHMEATRLWIDGKTVDELLDLKAINIWQTMPNKFKVPLEQHAKRVNGFDVLSLAFLMGHYWYAEQWHTVPEDQKSLDEGVLLGNHISTAKDIARLYKVGKFDKS